MKVQARVAAYLDPSPRPQAKAIRQRPLDEKPYWDIERARIGQTRKVPVEVVVNGYPVARREIVRRRQHPGRRVRRAGQEIELGRAADLALLAHQPDLRARRRQADPGLEEVGRVVPEGVDQCWSQKERAIRPVEKDEARKAYDVARQATGRSATNRRTTDSSVRVQSEWLNRVPRVRFGETQVSIKQVDRKTITVTLVRPGVGTNVVELTGSTVADLLRQTGASTCHRSVFIGDKDLAEYAVLERA